MSQKVYINAATHISLQQPLSEEWLVSPVMPTQPYQRSQDPNFRDWLNPLQSRRMGKILKRALVTAQKVMLDSGISQPEAVITGTGLGCIENTELFLDQLCREGEEMLKPTYFMQSTHNTISSLIAIQQHCHGYNTTYSHKSVSFDSALLDAFLQLQLGDIKSALVTGNDEMTPSYFSILQRTGYIGQPGQVTASEASAALMLSACRDNALCEVESVTLHSSHSNLQLPPSASLDAVLVGTNGMPLNDRLYHELAGRLANVPILHYKHLFGESYTASGLGAYAAAHLLHRGMAPAFMREDGVDVPLPLHRLLMLNHSDSHNISCLLLCACS